MMAASLGIRAAPLCRRAERRAEHRRVFGRDAGLTLEAASEEYQRGDFSRMREAAEGLLLHASMSVPMKPRAVTILAKIPMDAHGALQESRIAWSGGQVDHLPPLLAAGRGPGDDASPPRSAVSGGLLPTAGRHPGKAGHRRRGRSQDPDRSVRRCQAALDLFGKARKAKELTLEPPYAGSIKSSSH